MQLLDVNDDKKVDYWEVNLVCVCSRAIVWLFVLGKVFCSPYVLYGVSNIHQQILVLVHVNATAT